MSYMDWLIVSLFLFIVGFWLLLIFLFSDDD